VVAPSFTLNGSRFRAEIAPRISDFVLSMSHGQPSRRNGALTKASKAVSEAEGAVRAPDKRNGTTTGFAASKVTH
jgi:hypothetical protein